MEEVKKKRKPRVWDPIKILTRNYRAQVRAAHREIDLCAKTGRSTKVITLNYVKDVICPLGKLLKERLPDHQLSVSDKVEKFGTNNGFFTITAGDLVVGGLSYAGSDASHINFTVFAHCKPWGKAIKITKVSQLSNVITEVLDFIDPCNIISDEN